MPIQQHISVLLNEVIESFDILKSGGIVADCTIGGGGHAEGLLSNYPLITLIGLDRDSKALEISRKRLERFEKRVQLFEANFSDLDSVLDSIKVQKLNGIFADLGMSSFQLDDEKRGFSFEKSAPLDMKMGLNTKSAFDVLNTYSEKEIARIIYEYGEERFSRRIARRVVESRPIATTDQLVKIVVSSIPRTAQKRWKSTLRRVFQAIRIEVNTELDNLRILIETSRKRLEVGGRLAIISFHSLEDRIVKRAFLSEGFVPITKKPITPSELERTSNSRSRSAKLRIAEKV